MLAMDEMDSMALPGTDHIAVNPNSNQISDKQPAAKEADPTEEEEEELAAMMAL